MTGPYIPFMGQPLGEGLEFRPYSTQLAAILKRSYTRERYEDLKRDRRALMQETKRVVRSLHVAIRLCFEGDVGIASEVVRFLEEPTLEDGVWEPPYTKAWNRNLCRVDEGGVEKLKELIFVDYVICLDGLLIPEERGSNTERFAFRCSEVLNKYYEKREDAFRDSFLWYQLRSAILHGDQPKDYEYLWKCMRLKESDWISLCQHAEIATREALWWMLRKKIWDRQRRRGGSSLLEREGE